MFESLSEILGKPEVRNMLEQRVKSESPIESRMLTELTRWGFKPKTQVKIGKYRVDILIDEPGLKNKVVVECDGEQYHQDKEKDKKRDRDLLTKGYLVARFRGTDIYNNVDFCVAFLVKDFFPEFSNKIVEFARVEEEELYNDWVLQGTPYQIHKPDFDEEESL